MAHVVMAWELGGGNGHLTKLRMLAAPLLALGHTVSVISRNAEAGQPMFQPLAVPVLQAPLAPELPFASPADSYGQMLLHCGFSDLDALVARLALWRDAFTRLRPDLLIADFAPTAMLAARLHGIPVAAIGQGYTLPPCTNPLPFSRPWEPVPANALRQQDDAATMIINAAIGTRSAMPRLRSLADLFDTRARFLCTFPELDHYPDRQETDYYGPVYAETYGIDPPWPTGPGPRLFAYVNAAHPAFHPLIAALHNLKVPTVMHARGLGAEASAQASTATLQICSQPVHVQAALAGCDAVVCQGIGTVSAALVAGRPVLLMPEYLEQDMTLHRLHQQGLGVGVPRDAGDGRIAAALRFLLDDPGMRGRSAAFAAHYHGFSPTLPAEAIADACNNLLLGCVDL